MADDSSAAAAAAAPSYEELNDGSGSSAAAAPIPYPLLSGQLVYALAGALGAAALAAIPYEDLSVDLIGVLPDEIDGWQSLTKRALKKRMTDLRWSRLKDEKIRQQAERAATRKRQREDNDATTGAAPSAHRSSAAVHKAREKARWDAALLRGVPIVIDCSFDALMTRKEANSMVQQCAQMYGTNRASDAPARVYLTSLNERDDLWRGLSRIVGFADWRLWAHTADYLSLFRDGREDGVADIRGAGARAWCAPAPASGSGLISTAAPAGAAGGNEAEESGEGGTTVSDLAVGQKTDPEVGAAVSGAAAISDAAAAATAAASSDASSAAAPTPAATAASGLSRLVYLSADSPHTLTRLALDGSELYVIGGIVDRNRHKGLTLAKAEAAGIRHARLPLDGDASVSGCAMLTTLHVFQILLHVAAAGGGGGANGSKVWAAAVARIVPARKQCGGDGDEGEEGEGEEGGAAAGR